MMTGDVPPWRNGKLQDVVLISGDLKVIIHHLSMNRGGFPQMEDPQELDNFCWWKKSHLEMDDLGVPIF